MCFYFAKTSHKSNITGLKTAKSASVSTEKLYRKIFHNKQKQIQRVLLVRCNRADYFNLFICNGCIQSTVKDIQWKLQFFARGWITA